MATSLVRGKYVVCKVTGRREARVIEDGAVFQRDGVIVDVGAYAELSKKHRADETIGTAEHVVLPGFVNSHHHLGLTPLQTGSPDYPLEHWWASRLAKRDVDLSLDTLHSASEMTESGITTVQHMHSRMNGPIANIEAGSNEIIRAYEHIGMRVSYSYGIREQNRFVYAADEEFVKYLPADLGSEVGAMLRAQTYPLEDNFALFESLHRTHESKERVRIQLSPTNLHWCSDKCLQIANDYCERFRIPMHVNWLERWFKKESPRRRTETTAGKHLRDLAVLGKHLTPGHGVWVPKPT